MDCFLDNQKDSEKKKDIRIILDSVINKCLIDILRIIDEKKDESLNFLDALDKVYESYNLEDEIILNYEEEIIKSGLKIKDLKLKPKEVEIIIQKIKDQIYKNYIENFKNKTH